MNELAELYASKTDEELLLLCVDAGNLTSEAREMLESEMSRRKLTQRQADELRSDLEFEEEVERKKAQARKLGENGRARFGKANRVFLPKTNRERFTTTVFLTLGHFPVIPLGTYRVERLKKSWRDKLIVLEKLPLDWEQVLRVWTAASAILLVAIWALKLWLRYYYR